MDNVIFNSSISSLPLLVRGKVRDNYAVGKNKLLIIATDRLSAFDVVLPDPIPGKGATLTKLSLFWFEQLKKIVPNHLTGENPESVVAQNERGQVRNRAMIVQRLKPIPIEAVVRGYLAGSAWTEYRKNRSISGIEMPNGLLNAGRLPWPIFTPATKAEAGRHDENITFNQMAETVGSDLATQIREVSLKLYSTAADFALKKGIIIADTKFEFGLNPNNQLVLMDEILTPDSSRFWLTETYVQGANPPSFDKQFIRDWLEQTTIDGSRWNKQAPAPVLPNTIICRTTEKYTEALQRLIM